MPSPEVSPVKRRVVCRTRRCRRCPEVMAGQTISSDCDPPRGGGSSGEKNDRPGHRPPSHAEKNSRFRPVNMLTGCSAFFLFLSLLFSLLCEKNVNWLFQQMLTRQQLTFAGMRRREKWAEPYPAECVLDPGGGCADNAKNENLRWRSCPGKTKQRQPLPPVIRRRQPGLKARSWQKIRRCLRL